MKRKFFLGLVVVLAVGFAVSSTAFAQEKKVRPSLKASVSQTIGVGTDITFDFDTSAYVGNRQFANLMGQYIARERYILQARQQLLATLVELQEALAEW